MLKLSILFSIATALLTILCLSPKHNLTPTILAQSKNQSKPITDCSQIDPSYDRVAEATGGFVFPKSVDDYPKDTISIELMGSGLAQLLFVKDTLAGADKQYPIPVDSTVERLYVMLTCAKELTIKRPDGSTVKESQAGVRINKLSISVLAAIDRPEPGNWTFIVSGGSRLSLRVLGRSNLNFEDFNFVELMGSPGHEGYSKTNSDPIQGKLGAVIARTSVEQIKSAQFDLRKFDGAVLQKLGAKETPDQKMPVSREFFAKLIVPAPPFLAYVTGVNSKGELFQRLHPQVVFPQVIQIIAPNPEIIKPGQSVELIFKIVNFGESGEFELSVTDTLNYIGELQPQKIKLAKDESREIKVRVTIPKQAEYMMMDDVIVALYSTRNSESGNSASVQIGVDRKQ